MVRLQRGVGHSQIMTWVYTVTQRHRLVCSQLRLNWNSVAQLNPGENPSASMSMTQTRHYCLLEEYSAAPPRGME
jgi:hypothetical protein